MDEDAERTQITSIKVSIITKAEWCLVREITVPLDGVLDQERFLYPNCTRSSITVARMKAPVDDFAYGDFVVHDIIFDGSGDFALKVDVGGDVGRIYRVYEAGVGSLMPEDECLNGEFSSMPVVDPQRKVMTVYSYYDASGRYSTVNYRYDPEKKRWSKVSR